MKGTPLKKFIIIVVGIAALLFLYVAILTEIKNLNKERLNKIEALNERHNRIETKIVEIQKLTAEDRIVKIAVDSLKMIRPQENFETIHVSKEQVEQIERLVNEKYD
ncbi:MAG: hypothetical protein HYS25_03135 [Ignavibacteriales bacterium]|nr:hypothetical protein [Ignavibacteriales bacterium]